MKDGSYTLSCNKFVEVLPSKKHSEYLDFESNGIEPEITLHSDRDWIKQLNDYLIQDN